MSLRSILTKLSTTLVVPEFPDEPFQIGIPPGSTTISFPGFYIDLVKGRYQSKFLMSSESTHTEADFQALLMMHQDVVPANDNLDLFTIQLGESLIRKIITDNDAGVYKTDGDLGFRAEPFLLEHYFTDVATDPRSGVRVLIRVSQFGR